MAVVRLFHPHVVGAAVVLVGCGRLLALDGDENPEAAKETGPDAQAQGADGASGGSTVDDAEKQDGATDASADATAGDGSSGSGDCVASGDCAVTVQECCSKTNGGGVCGGVCAGDVCCL